MARRGGKRLLPRKRGRHASFLFVLALSATRSVSAEEAFGGSSGTIARVESNDPALSKSDGVYGRFNGDLALEIGAGIEIDPAGSNVRPLVVGDLSIYQSAGLYGAFRRAVTAGDPVTRALSLGIEVSPLFLIRWPRALESGPAFGDLTLDSLGIFAGLHLYEPKDGSFADEAGFEAGLTLGAPLLGKANGLWLRTRGGLSTAGEDLGGSVWLYLSWQGFVHAGILQVDD